MGSNTPRDPSRHLHSLLVALRTCLLVRVYGAPDERQGRAVIRTPRSGGQKSRPQGGCRLYSVPCMSI